MDTNKSLPWSVSSSINKHLNPEKFPRSLGAVALGKVGDEDTTWLIHDTGEEYFITRVERGGSVSSVKKHKSHPLQMEGSYQHPLKFKVHMDARALSPRKGDIIEWLQRLCERAPRVLAAPKGLVVGDVIFTGDKSLIRSATRSPWSHAALYIGKGTVAEAMLGSGGRVRNARRLWKGGGVFRSSAEALLKRNHVAVLRHPEWALLSEDEFGAYSALGWHEGYSVVSALRSLLSKSGLVRPKPKGVFCSQFVLEVYYKLGLEQLEHRVRDPYSVTPGDLFTLLKEIGFEAALMRLDARGQVQLSRAQDGLRKSEEA